MQLEDYYRILSLIVTSLCPVIRAYTCNNRGKASDSGVSSQQCPFFPTR
jgi:hypothetical protein